MTNEQARIMGKAIGEAITDKMTKEFLADVFFEVIDKMCCKHPTIFTPIEQLGRAIGEGISKK